MRGEIAGSSPHVRWLGGFVEGGDGQTEARPNLSDRYGRIGRRVLCPNALFAPLTDAAIAIDGFRKANADTVRQRQ